MKVLQYILAISILCIVVYFGIVSPIIRMVRDSKARKNKDVNTSSDIDDIDEVNEIDENERNKK